MVSLPLGWVLFGLRGPYFAIGTLGVAIAAGEMFGTWEWIGAGQGISMPPFPGDPDTAKYVLYMMCMCVGVATFAVIAWLSSNQPSGTMIEPTMVMTNLKSIKIRFQDPTRSCLLVAGTVPNFRAKLVAAGRFEVLDLVFKSIQSAPAHSSKERL